MLAVGCVPTSPPPTPVARLEPTLQRPAETEAATSIPPTATVRPTDTVPPAPTDTAIPTLPPTASPTETAVPTAEPVAVDLALSAENINLYPVPQLVEGDQVTFQIQADVPDGIDPREVDVSIAVDGQEIVDGTLAWRNLNNDAVGLFEWAWTVPDGGSYEIAVVLDPDDRIQAGDENPFNNAATKLVETIGAETVLAPDAEWISAETAYANLHVVSGTAAHRDLNQLSVLVDAAMRQAAAALQIEVPNKTKIDLYFVDRIFGQGGYAGQAIVITYTDRNYSGGGLFEVLVHESVHVLDNGFEPQGPFRFFVEGLAVWATGGHYKQEDLSSRAAALLATDAYLPIRPLMNNFYPSQHETGYIEAGSLFGYLVQTYGWDNTKTFYNNLRYPRGATDVADAVDIVMREQFNKSLDQITTDWRVYLRDQTVTANDITDLQTTIRYYEMMRDYQQRFDETAYYLRAWLPYPAEMLERNITADVTRRSQAPEAVAIEAMLEAADIALRNLDYDTANTLLDSVGRVLDADGRFLDPIAESYLQIAEVSAEMGYEAQKIDLGSDNTAIVLATAVDCRAPSCSTAELLRLNLTLEPDPVGWVLTR